MSWTRPWNRFAHRGGLRLLLGALAAGALMSAAVPAAYAGKFERRPVLLVHGFESAGSNRRPPGCDAPTLRANFVLKGADLQRVSEEAASPGLAAIQADYRRLSPFQAPLAISA